MRMLSEYLIVDGSLDWDFISHHKKLSEDFIREFKDKVNWKNISRYQKLSEDFIKEFKYKLDWCWISICQELSKDFTLKYQDKIYWNARSLFHKIDEDIIIKINNQVNSIAIKIDSIAIFGEQKISENYIKNYSLVLDNNLSEKVWQHISFWQKLSEEFIMEFKEDVNWEAICHSQILFEQFIVRYELIHKINWKEISYCQQLSENLIRSYKDKVDWIKISEYQKLSEEFIEEFKDKLDVGLAKEVNNQPDRKTRIDRAEKYAKRHSLEIDENYIYAVRKHNKFNNGHFKKTIFYEKGKYYKD